MTQPLILSTLADYAGRYDLVATCEACYRSGVVLDLQALITTYGADTKVGDVRLRLVCRVCGEKPHRATVALKGAPGYR